MRSTMERCRRILFWFVLAALRPAPDATASWSQCGSDKCCTPAGSHLRIGPTTSYPVSITTVAMARACFEQLGFVSDGIREQIVSNLQAKLQYMYVFYDVIYNSTAVDSCNVPYKIHEMNYDIKAALHNSSSQRNAWQFFAAIAQAFRQLNDAHAQFYSPFHPWNYFRPVTFSSRLSSDGNQEIFISAVNPLLRILDPDGKAIFRNEQQWSSYINHTVKSINNVDALTFVKKQADEIGLYKSRGIRFNKYLKRAFFSLGLHDMPDSDEEVYELENGLHVTASLFVVVTDPRVVNGTENLLAYVTAQEGSIMSPTRSPILLKKALAYDNYVSLYNQSENWKLKLSSATYAGDLSVIFELDNAMVLKLQDGIGISQDNGFVKENLESTFQRLAQRGAKRKSKTLIIDVLGNDGGVLSSTYALMGMLIGKRLLDPKALCELYDRRVSSLWDQWIIDFANVHWAGRLQELSEGQLDELFQLVVTQNADFRKNFDLEMSTFYQADVEPKLVLPLQKLMISASSTKLKVEDARKILRDFLTKRPFSLKTRNNEWFPMTELVNPYPGQVYTNLSYYRQPIARMRGGRTGYYTQKFFRRCIDGWRAAKALARSSYLFNEIIFLTDGTCGGACSLALSKLQIEGYAKVVSVGGVLGEEIDTSFGGGYIEDFSEFFEEVRLSEVLGRILFNTSASEPFMALEKPPAPVKFSMTMNELYLKKLGTCALPREWYLIPAQKHLNVWLSQADNWPAPDHKLLLNIYRQAAHFDEIPTPPGSSPRTDSTTKSSKSGGLSRGDIAVIVIASVLFVALLVSVLLYMRVRRYKKEQTPGDYAQVSLMASDDFSDDN